MSGEIAGLLARIDECCSRLDAADKLSVTTAKRLDRLEARIRDARRALRVELEVLRLRTKHLEEVCVKGRGDR